MKQRLRPTRFSALLLLTLLFSLSAQPAHAQLSQLKWRFHGGVLQPMAVGGTYFRAGPSINVDAGYPITSKLAAVLDLGWDYLNTDQTHPTPVTNLWRYRAELEGNLVGDDESGLTVRAFGGVGGTTVYSHKFWLVSQQAKHLAEEGVAYTYEGERLRGTGVTAAGGLRLGLKSPDGITWWLSGKLNWTPLNDFNQSALHEVATQHADPTPLDPIKSVMGVSITLGVSL